MTVGGLHASVQRRIDALLDDAEASRTIVVASHGDADALKRRASRGQLASPAENLYVRDAYWSGLDPAERALHLMRAEASRHPTWRFRSYSAALVWGLDVPHALVGALHIIADRPPNAPHCRARRPSSRDDYALRDGMNVTSFWQTVAECLCEAPFSYGLAIADSALHMRGTTNEELLDRLSIADDRTGIAQARLIASCADGRAENGGESRVRAYLIAQGYQIPELQVEFPNPTDPAHPYRVDFFLGADRAAWHHRRVRRHGKVPGSSAAQRSNHDRGAGRRASARIPADLVGASGPTVHLSGPSPSHPAKSGARKRWHTPGPRGGASLARCLESGKASLNTAPDRGGASRRTFSRRVCRCASVRAFARASRRAVRRVHFARKDCNILQDRALKTGPFLANRCNLFLHFVRRISPSENGCAAHRAHLAR